MSLVVNTNNLKGRLKDLTPYQIGFSINRVKALKDVFILSFIVSVEENNEWFPFAPLTECYNFKKGQYTETLKIAFFEFEEKTGIQLLKSNMKITA